MSHLDKLQCERVGPRGCEANEVSAHGLIREHLESDQRTEGYSTGTGRALMTSSTERKL